MAIFAGESPLMLSGDAKKDLELIRNYIYERDMELRHILSHLDESNFVEGFVDKLSPVNNITNEYNEYNEIIEGGDEPSGSIDLENATGILPVAKGGTGADTAAAALTALGGQKQMCVATASTTSSAVAGGADIPLRIFTEYDPLNNFTNARYNSTYGYGIRCVKAGKYLVSAMATLKSTVDEGTTATLAIRKVVGGTSTYIARAGHTFKATSDGSTLVISPIVVNLNANTYLSLYQSLNTVQTLADGCHLTAIYLGE